MRGATILFGGSDGSTATRHADTWEYRNAAWAPVPLSSVPPPLVAAAMTCDHTRGCLVLSGGQDGVNFVGDSWELAGTGWVHVPAPVPPRFGHAMVYDRARGRAVLTGGYGGGPLPNDTWEYDGNAWVLAVPPQSPLLTLGSMAYDTRRRRMLGFGPSNPGPFPNPVTCELRNDVWRRLVVGTSPPPLQRSAIAFDAQRDRVVVFGGSIFSGPRNDTWEFDGTAWRLVPTATSPTTAFGSACAMAYDAARGRMVCCGGLAAFETWEYDGFDWRQKTTSVAPPARGGHAMAYDGGRERIVMYGGMAASVLSDTWIYDGSDWSRQTTSTPPALFSPTMAFDTTRGVLAVTGRSTGSVRQTWQLEGSTWSPVSTVAVPGAFSGNTLAYDAISGRMILACEDANDGTWELVSAPIPTWSRHGLGCPGSAGVPVLELAPNAVPALGSSPSLVISSLPAASGAALLAMGFLDPTFAGYALPLPLGAFGLPCQLWIAPAPGGISVVPHSGGSASAQLSIPAAPALAGLGVGAQAFVLDRAAPGGLGSLTNGIVMRLH